MDWFNLVLRSFATAVVSWTRQDDPLSSRAALGKHMSTKVDLPEGIIFEPLPPYSPELQPAERLWALADEPLVNQSFETLDALEVVLAQRCQILTQMTS